MPHPAPARPPLPAACLSLLLLSGLAAASEWRNFRSTDGESVRARLEGLEDGKVTLRREDGIAFAMPLDLLAEADRLSIEETTARLSSEAAKLNQAAGHEWASTAPLDGRAATDIAMALRLHPESRSRHGQSWRLYASRVSGYRLFGAMPYSVALYSNEDGTASSLSIVYANKGDFGSTAGSGEDHFSGGTDANARSLAQAMARDEETVAAAIQKALGEGRVQRYGEGKTRRKVTRWDWNGHSLLHSHEDGEYVGLSIVTTDEADGGGRSRKMRDADLKQRLVADLKRSPNGDVVITEIPMVDQGPKGYCVPATFERAMRTMGLEADMYLLAMVGETRAGGGTSMNLLFENVRSQVYRKGRRTKEESYKQLRIRDIKRTIDQGIPIIWSMCSVKEYNQIANENTRGRQAADTTGHYARLAEKTAEIIRAPKPAENYHACMIIGYNETTREIAVSDSWGPSYELRWIPEAVADWVSTGGYFMILP